MNVEVIKCPYCGDELMLLPPWEDTEDNEYNYYCPRCDACINIFLNVNGKMGDEIRERYNEQKNWRD